jgi:hypothetical protein
VSNVKVFDESVAPLFDVVGIDWSSSTHGSRLNSQHQTATTSTTQQRNNATAAEPFLRRTQRFRNQGVCCCLKDKRQRQKTKDKKQKTKDKRQKTKDKRHDDDDDDSTQVPK